MEPQDGQGCLEPSGETSTHKCARVTCNSTSSRAFPSGPEGKACSCPFGQHICSLPCKPSGGHQIHSLTDRGSETSPVGFTSPSESQSSSSTRRGELCCGSTLQTETTVRRVETEPCGGPDGLGEVWCSRGGPLCLERDNTLSTVVLPLGTRQSAGAGCSGTCMAKLSSVCLSPSSAVNVDAAQDRPEQSQSAVGCSVLAGEALVSHDSQAPRWGTLGSTPEEGPVVTVRREHMASSPGAPPSVPVALEGPDSLLTSCDQAVVQTVLNARATSTRTLYDNRWKLFVSWCESRKVDPERCPVPVLLNYLQDLLEKGLSVSTIKVYVAAISARHNLVEGRSVGSHSLVCRFLKGALRLRPPRLARVPSWDLPLVLEGLCSQPFEPVESAALKWVSAKTAFLLAICSAKRVGELHALSVAEDCLRWNSDGSGVTLWPNPSFLPKRLSVFHVNQPVSLAVFAPQSEVSVSSSLCPVRMLKQYISVTAECRKTDALFVCYGGHKQGVLCQSNDSHIGLLMPFYSRTDPGVFSLLRLSAIPPEGCPPPGLR